MNTDRWMETCRDCLEQFWTVDGPVVTGEMTEEGPVGPEDLTEEDLADITNMTLALDRLRRNGLFGFSLRAFSSCAFSSCAFSSCTPSTCIRPIFVSPWTPGGRLLDVVPLNSAPAPGEEKLRFLLTPIDAAARRAVTAARMSAAPPPFFAFCDGDGRAVLVPDGLVSDGSSAPSDAACLQTWTLFLDPRWDKELERPPVRAAVDAAVGAVNDALQGRAPLWELFWRVPFGWNINVVPDTRMTLADRMRELPGWPGPTRIDALPRNGRERPHEDQRRDAPGPGGVEDADLLGLYHADSVSNGKYPRSPSSHIVLFVQAIEEYCDAMALPQEDRWEVYFYVLAHELFHALQDFHVSLPYFERRFRIPLGAEHELPNGETFAEYFALHAVRYVLGDRWLFRALCAGWGRVTANDPYAAALTAFGGIQAPDSRLLFRGAANAWELKQRSR